MQFKFKDLIITSLGESNVFECDAGNTECEGGNTECENAITCPGRSCPENTLASDQCSPAVSFEDLQELRLLLKHVLARLDLALYESEMKPKSVQEIDAIQAKLAQVQEELQQERNRLEGKG